MSNPDSNIFDAPYEELGFAEPVKDADFSQQPNMPLAITQQADTSNDYRQFFSAALAGSPSRDMKAMVTSAKQIGSAMGKSAIYSFPAGGGRIEGPSIDLAYALAQSWGKCVTQCIVIAVAGNRVTIRGRFVDLLTVAIVERDYNATLSPPPGKFANKPEQADRWRVMQEQAAISKAVRGAILGGLPAWYVDAAIAAARETMTGNALGNNTLPQAISQAIDHFGKMGIGKTDLESHVARPYEVWTVYDVVTLRELAADIKAGRVNQASVKAQPAAAEPAKGPDALLGKNPAVKETKTEAPKPEQATASEPAANDEGEV